MPIVSVDAADDPRIADYRNVPDAELIEQRGLFVAEGRLVVRRLLESRRMRTRSVMVTLTAQQAIADVLESRPDLPIYVAPQPLINEITGFNIHRGCLALGERPAPIDWRTVTRSARLAVILERVSNADNVGGIFRNAAAFGVDAVLLGPGCTDPLYRKAIRTSMAAALAIPFSSLLPWPSALDELRESGVTTIALTPALDVRTIAECIGDARTNRIAIVVGHEGEGLTREALDACEQAARIPMAPGVDSLNVATATAIALYEIAQHLRRPNSPLLP